MKIGTLAEFAAAADCVAQGEYTYGAMLAELLRDYAHCNSVQRHGHGGRWIEIADDGSLEPIEDAVEFNGYGIHAYDAVSLLPSVAKVENRVAWSLAIVHEDAVGHWIHVRYTDSGWCVLSWHADAASVTKRLGALALESECPNR